MFRRMSQPSEIGPGAKVSVKTGPSLWSATGLWLLLALLCVSAPAVEAASSEDPMTLFMALGDSLTHGTMDGTNNEINTLKAYIQRIADSLQQVEPLRFSQPLLDTQAQRINPYQVPTNLGVDGSDIFSIEGIEYYKRAGTRRSYLSPSYLCDKLLATRLEDTYDKVMYPLNIMAHRPVSQVDAALWLLNNYASSSAGGRVFLVFWMGNNDSGGAALGLGGKNPNFFPIPFDQIKGELKPELTLLLSVGQALGLLSFSPFTQGAIERNLTELDEFTAQYQKVLRRLKNGVSDADLDLKALFLTLPYYSAVGYLFDSDDLEYYLKKVAPSYTVPPTFLRVCPPGEPITNPLKGDRVSLFTFGLMYALLSTGYSPDYVNQILEQEGQQEDGLVLSEQEQEFIMTRIDGFNNAIKASAALFGPNAYVIDVGRALNDALTGKTPILIDGRTFNRKWVRGSSFSLDGVHPGYTGHALIANMVLTEINTLFGLQAPGYDLSAILKEDVYVDHDGDGWAPGPVYEPTGLTELLFLYKDPDDQDPSVQVELPSNVWDLISDILLDEMLGIPSLRSEAEARGVIPIRW